MQSVRILEIPACKMVSSGDSMFGEDKLERFNAWFSRQPVDIFPRDFLTDGAAEGKLCWLYMYTEGTDVPAEFEIIDFRGGLYAVATDIDQKTDVAAMSAAVDEFLAANGFERDKNRPEMGNIITAPSAQKVMGYCQMDYYTPIKPQGV